MINFEAHLSPLSPLSPVSPPSPAIPFSVFFFLSEIVAMVCEAHLGESPHLLKITDVSQEEKGTLFLP